MELEELSVDQMTSAPGHREEKIRGSRTRRWRKRKERKEIERKRKKKKKKIEKKRRSKIFKTFGAEGSQAFFRSH